MRIFLIGLTLMLCLLISIVSLQGQKSAMALSEMTTSLDSLNPTNKFLTTSKKSGIDIEVIQQKENQTIKKNHANKEVYNSSSNTDEAIRKFQQEFCGLNTKPNSNAYVTEYVLPQTCEMPLGIAVDSSAKKVWYVSTKKGVLGSYNIKDNKFDPERTIPGWKAREDPRRFSQVWDVKIERKSGDVWFTDEKQNAIWRYIKSSHEFEIYNIPDKKNLDQLTHAVTVLSSAYYFTDSPKYASKTKELLRVWFLDDSSKMNPNLKYSEMVRGKNNSQPAGIMAGRNLTDIIDSIRLIQNYPEWTSDDNSGIKSWFTRYLSWLLNSTSGRNEAQKMNNHGTYYYIQVSDIALFLNRTDLARSIIGSFMRPPSLSSFMAPELSIYSKIQPDGRQLFELQRSRALDYSMFNLLGLFKLANLGEHLELDLWNFRTGKDPLLQKALDFLIPYLTKKQDWPYSQSTQINLALASDLVCQAIAHYPQRKPMYSESYNFLARNTAFIHMDNLLPCVS